jgi:hypothetical protein
MSREPMTVDQLIADLEVIRAAHGGDAPVRLLGMNPVVDTAWLSRTPRPCPPCAVVVDERFDG